MKIFCLVLDLDDHKWLAPFWEGRSTTDQIVVVAPTFDGRVICRSLDIPFKTYEEVAWGLDKPAIHDLARRQSAQWHKLQSLKDNLPLRLIREFNRYPILDMHQPVLLLAILEIIQAHRFIHKILKVEQPDRIMYGERENPFLVHPIFIIAGSNGVEREVVKSILTRHNPQDKFSPDQFLAPPPEFTLPVADPSIFNWSADQTGPKIMIFAWGDYYLDYFEKVLEKLLLQKARIVMVITGGDLKEEQRHAWQSKGICVFKKSSWLVPNQEAIWSAWSAKCAQAAEGIYNNRSLEDYFSDDHGTYYPGLANHVLCKQIMETPSTVVELLRAESMIRAFAPEMVLNHFCIHPLESCNVLPGRMLGIPTLTLDHGVHGYIDTQRVTFATEYYGVTGSCFRDALLMAVKAPPSNVCVVGNTRYDDIESEAGSPADYKLGLDLDPTRPLCIFCDNSGWSHMYEWRHSTSASAEAITSLKSLIPGLQIIYRVHHGAGYKGMSAFFNNLNDPDIHFQVSPNPALVDILPAADIVIAHYTSAVTESLLHGVPVIYLTALGEPEPSYFGCEAIKIANSFEELPVLISELLKASLPREDVRRKAQSYFDIALAGNDGKASERLAEMILKLAALPREELKPGFQDWMDRIDASCNFDVREFRKFIPTSATTTGGKPFVSVIIPSFNRDKMIGITLDSFVSQDYPLGRFEIIVADNNSTDSTKDVVTAWQAKSPIPIVYLFEERQGVHYARNSAAKGAKGDILYFTDDDMFAEPNLLSELVKLFSDNPGVGTATGKVLAKWEVEPPEWIKILCNNFYLSLNDLGEETIVADHDIGVFSCHQAITREAFFKAGGFNPESTFTEYVGDGETGLNIKIKQWGYKFGYNGRSVIHHMIPASRMTQDYLNKRLANQGSADCYTEYKKHRFSSEQLADRVQSYVTSLIEKTSLCTEKRMDGDIRWRMDKAYTHYYLSRIEYDLRLMKDPAWRELVLKDNWLDEE